MGLDIHFAVDNEEDIFTSEYSSNEKLYYSHKLSRTFCNFMCRKYVCSGLPEFEQIGKLTELDISPFYEMENYIDDYEIEEQLEMIETEIEKENFKKSISDTKERLKGNIVVVHDLITKLIDRLSKIENLEGKLDHGDHDTLNSDFYFSNFNSDPGDGYIGNNFGQDLRNFKRFVEYAKTKGTSSVFFHYN